MLSVTLSFAIALAVTAALTPLVLRVSLALGVRGDMPSARRVHTRRVPRLGGIAIVIGFFVPLLALFALSTQTAQLFFASPRMVAGVMLGSLLVAGLGFFDDVVGTGAKAKLLVQVLAATMAYGGGLRIDALSLPLVGVVGLHWLALPATIVWIVGVVNALNLIDGLDGLAAGVTFFACVTNFVVAFLGGNILICLVSATLAGALVGFLFYNFNPAKIFMGDSGSMFLGFMLASASLLGASSQKSPTVIAILVPLVALGLPIMDMLFAIVRRFLARRSIFAADRGHIHHRLLDVGLTHRRAVLTLYGLCLALTAVALAIHFGRSWHVGAALSGLAVVFVVMFRLLGATLARQFQGGADALTMSLRRGVPAYLTRISSARGPEELGGVLERFAREHRLLAVELSAGPGARATSFRWETSDVGARGFREATSVRFELNDADGVSSVLEFFVDSANGIVAPQSEILLQLVADAAEDLLKRVAKARAATATGRLRTVS